MEIAVEGTIIYWRGPAPFYFLPISSADCETLREIQKRVTYGWGMIPVEATIGDCTWTTSLFPKDGAFLLPLKNAVRSKSAIKEGDTIHVKLTIKICA